MKNPWVDEEEWRRLAIRYASSEEIANEGLVAINLRKAMEDTMGEELKLTNDLGRSLLSAARESRQKRITDLCIGEIETVIGLIEITEGRITAEVNKLAVFKARLAAIEAGAVTVKVNSGVVSIQYYDEKIDPRKVGY